MQFSKVAILSAITGSVFASYNSTATDIKTTVITITSCHEDKCTAVPVTTGLTTVSKIDTVYTTYCPLPSTAPPASTAPPVITTSATSAPPKNVTVIPGAGAKLQVGAALIGAAALMF
ncbi:uncharacterized protein LODBEIA_P00790 [Lodderomyces beijingensis]|uniref:Uncharacterized protein n=1 Tax=Lodderomyces beijingensis TaxID=1775926 RepID=A0ABP0ZF96_9ASCO